MSIYSNRNEGNNIIVDEIRETVEYIEANKNNPKYTDICLRCSEIVNNIDNLIIATGCCFSFDDVYLLMKSAAIVATIGGDTECAHEAADKILELSLISSVYNPYSKEEVKKIIEEYESFCKWYS